MAKKSKSGKKGRKGWTTEEQIAYLESQKASYLAAQSTKKLSEFWPPVEEEWFTQWPTTLTKEDIEEGKTIADVQNETKTVRITNIAFEIYLLLIHQRLAQWFNNHTRATSSGNRRRKLLDLSAKKTKKRQSWQAYSRLYWETKLKEKVQDKWVAYKKTMTEKAAAENTEPPTFPDGAPLTFRNPVVQRLFAAESAEVKDEVERYRNGMAEDEHDQDATMDKWEVQCAAKAKQYHE